MELTQPIVNGGNRNNDGTFAVGNPGGPGRPTGSVSIVTKIKQKFLESPEYFDEWVAKLMEDPKERRAIMEQIDGKPHQTTDVTSQGERIVFLPSEIADKNGLTMDATHKLTEGNS